MEWPLALALAQRSKFPFEDFEGVAQKDLEKMQQVIAKKGTPNTIQPFTGIDYVPADTDGLGFVRNRVNIGDMGAAQVYFSDTVFNNSPGVPTFTKMPTFETALTAGGYVCSFHPNSKEFTLPSSATPYLAICGIDENENFYVKNNIDILPTSACYTTKYSPDGNWLVCGISASPRWSLYKNVDGFWIKQGTQSEVLAGTLFNVAFSPNSQEMTLAFYGGSPYLKIFHLVDGEWKAYQLNEKIPNIFTSACYACNYSSDNNWLAVGTSGGVLYVFSKNATGAWELVFTDQANTTEIYSVTFASDSDELYVTGNYLVAYKYRLGSWEKSTDRFDLATQASTTRSASISNDGFLYSIPLNNTPYLTSYLRKNRYWYRLASPSVLPLSQTRSAAYSNDGKWLLCYSSSTSNIAIYKITY